MLLAEPFFTLTETNITSAPSISLKFELFSIYLVYLSIYYFSFALFYNPRIEFRVANPTHKSSAIKAVYVRK